MRKIALLICITFVFTIGLGGCGAKWKKDVKEVKAYQVNCATAEQDLRILKQEKTRVGEQIVAGVTTIAPIGLVIGIVTRTAKAKLTVATGKYNKMIDAKMAEIKSECGID